ncbi:MAG: acyl-CoA dehydrogenase family protein [Verrucomicrobiota bacterium]
MNTLLSPPEKAETKNTAPDNVPEVAPAIDTSKMSAGQRAALELTEAARDVEHTRSTFASGLFMGRCDLDEVIPFPEQTDEDRAEGDGFLRKLEHLLKHHVDPDEIDRTGEIPSGVISELAYMGAFGIKIPRQYGGLGLSQTNYCRAAMLLGSYCGNLTALISAHQSIGVPQPLLLFGTEEQKRRFLPHIARGEISAFALTEPGVGSDPARMQTHAEPDADGAHFILNGEKLWCTNGTKAGVIVVMAKTPPKVVNGRSKDQITAFIVPMSSPGVKVTHRCRFMGLKALYNAVIQFRDVKVPRENILLGEGKGLKVALSTLNTGRLTLPAACTGLSKRCLHMARTWAARREQWGAPIGKHAAIADKLARMAASVFAMESMTQFTASKVDKDKHADIRLEAAMAKLWATERAWEIINDTMQIRGGRGYETAQSLQARGEEPVPVERLLRDSRINTIFEGSSEIMRLFIAREALDPHLKVGAAVLNTQLPMNERARAALRAGLFYAGWYPRQWWPFGRAPRTELHPAVSRHLRWAISASKRLARTLFHAMLRHGPKLERKQLLLGRIVDIGTELFAITATCARAQMLLHCRNEEECKEVLQLVAYFCADARVRINRWFRELRANADTEGYRVAQHVLDDKHAWLEEGIIGRI